MRSKRPFRSLIVCVSCAMVGCILASTAYSRRVDELEIERDIYASRFQNWQTRAIDAEENVGRLQTEVDNLTAERFDPYIRRVVQLHGLLCRRIRPHLRRGTRNYIQRRKGAAGRDRGS